MGTDLPASFIRLGDSRQAFSNCLNSTRCMGYEERFELAEYFAEGRQRFGNLDSLLIRLLVHEPNDFQGACRVDTCSSADAESRKP